jgi:hypothetical protein
MITDWGRQTWRRSQLKNQENPQGSEDNYTPRQELPRQISAEFIRPHYP